MMLLPLVMGEYEASLGGGAGNHMLLVLSGVVEFQKSILAHTKLISSALLTSYFLIGRSDVKLFLSRVTSTNFSLFTMSANLLV